MKDISQYWLVKTNQTWKLLVSFLLIFLSGLFFIMLLLAVNKAWVSEGFGELELELASIIFGISSLIWLCQSIRCPECGYKPAWTIIKTSSANEWLGKISKMEHCPVCKK